MTSGHLAMLRIAALLVPGAQRAEWIAEWRAELWYVERRATVFCLGAFRDAFWLRRNTPACHTGRTFSLESPVRCVFVLAALAAIGLLFAFRLPVARDILRLAKGRLVLNYLCLFPVSLLVLSAFTPLALGEYPANRRMRLRRWVFLAIKLALLLPIVVCWSLDLAAFMAMGFHSHGFLIGLVVGLRWALIDQRQRCPVCLCLLTRPTRIGGAGQIFLAWYGTELICAHGHGMLYVPEIPTSCYSTQRWQHLDASWSSLFS